MPKIFNRAGVSTTTAGTGTVTLGGALGAVAPNLASYLSFSSAGVSDGDPVYYLILDINGAFEVGYGTYTASGTTLSRTTILKSSNAGSAINLSGNAQVFITAPAENFREALTADRTYYVLTTGSDSNNGLANTAGGAFLTIQKALNTVAALDISTHNVTIQVGAGTYNNSSNTVTGPWVGSGTVTITGDTTTPSNVVVDPGASQYNFHVNTGGRLSIQGIKLTSSTAFGVGLGADSQSRIDIVGKMEFGAFAATGYHIVAQYGGVLFNNAVNYNISGGANDHVLSTNTGNVFINGCTVTITNTPAFATAFVECRYSSLTAIASNTFSGSATGTRFTVNNGAVIFTGGAGATYLPGNASGVGTNQGTSPYGLYN